MSVPGKIRCDWRSLGIEPGMTPDITVREEAAQVLEARGIVPLNAPHLHDFLNGGQLIAVAVESINVQWLIEQAGKGASRKLRAAYQAAVQFAEAELKRQLLFVPGRGAKPFTTHPVPDGFVVDDWEEYELLEPLRAVLRREAQLNPGKPFQASAKQVHNDTAFCIIQGARNVGRRAADIIEDDDVEELLGLGLYTVVKSVLNQMSPEVLELAWG